MMKLSDVVVEVNNPEIKIDDIAAKFNVSKEVVRDRLKRVGYKYDTKTRSYIFSGENQSEVDDLIFEDLVKSKSKNHKKITKKSDSIVEKEVNSLDENEIEFVKTLYKKIGNSRSELNEYRLTLDFHDLPLKNELKKHQAEISMETFKAFEEFADKMKSKRYSKNDLIEIALVRLMNDF